MTRHKRLQVALKRRKRVSDRVPNVIKRRSDTVFAGVSGIGKRYGQGEVEIHLHVNVGARRERTTVGPGQTNAISKYLCIVSHSLPRGNGLEDLALTRQDDFDNASGQEIVDHMETPMLIDVGELLQLPKEMVRIPSLVRLQPLDVCDDRGQQQFDPRGSLTRIFLRIKKDRESEPARIGETLHIRRELKDYVIEAGTEVLDAVSDDFTPVKRRVGSQVPRDDLDGILALMRLYIKGESISVEFDQAIQFLVKPIEVFDRPIELPHVAEGQRR